MTNRYIMDHPPRLSKNGKHRVFHAATTWTQLIYLTGHWCCQGCRPNAAYCHLLRKTSSWASSGSEAEGLAGTISSTILWQKSITCAYVFLYQSVESLMRIAYDLKTTAIFHIIGFLIVIGYAQNYYFHLRMLLDFPVRGLILTLCRPSQEQRPLGKEILF
jgi:hypothetical protein